MNMMKGSTETVDDQIGIGQEKGVMWGWYQVLDRSPLRKNGGIVSVR
jgi:hypothetical protein